jgi:hypothetical protein
VLDASDEAWLCYDAAGSLVATTAVRRISVRAGGRLATAMHTAARDGVTA